jgi:alpha-tubulin suppressor-like RCC1 family protein
MKRISSRLLAAPIFLVSVLLASAGPFPAPAGLVGWWKGDGTTLDSVAGNNGVNQNIGYTNGVVGQAFACDPESFPYGTYCGIDIPDQPAYALTNSLTIEGWIRQRGNGYAIFWRGDNRPGLDPYALSSAGDGTINFGITDANGNGVSVGTLLPFNVWVYVAGTLDGSSGTMSLYTNGVLAAQTNTSIRPFGQLIAGDSPGIGIGNVNDGQNNFPFLGDIDEISLYNRALTVAEIQGIYSAGSAGKYLTTNTCVALASGAVGWWKAEGNGLDSVNGQTGILENGLTFAPGEVGQAFLFNNTNADVRIPASVALNVGTGTGFTLEAWIEPYDLSAHLAPLFEWNTGDGTAWGVHFHLSQDAGPGSFYANIVDTSGNWHQIHSTVAPVVTNVFQHVALTYDQPSGVATIYCNGSIVAQQNLGTFTPQTSYNLFLGRRPPTGGETYSFSGLLDEPTVYNRALAKSEIAAIYNAGSAGKCQTSNPVSGLVLWNTLGSDTEVSNSVYGPNLQKYVGGTWPDVAANTSYGPGEFGNAVGIGPGGYISESRVHNLVLNNLTQCINPNQGTIDVWFLQNWTPTAYVDGAIRIFDGDYGLNSGMGFVSRPPPNNLAFGLTFGGTPTAVNYDITASNGTWLNLAGIWDIAGIDGSADKLRLYVNGQLVATATNATWGTMVGSQADIAGGEDSECAGQFLVDNLKVFNRALTASEVAQVYGGGEGFNSGPPAIFNFSPAAATNGAVVAIVGTNFSASAAANIVYFGAVRANVLSASPTSLTVTVPAGATFAPITVTVGGLIAYAPQPFLPMFAGSPNSVTTLAPRLDLPVGNSPGPVVLADLDGDGRVDVLICNGSTVSIYQNISSNNVISAASFAPRVDLTVGSGLDQMAVADVDGDGLLDIVLLNNSSNQLLVLKNISTPGMLTTNSFAAPVVLPTGNDPRGLAVQDLDGDGKPELIVGNWADSTITIFRNTGLAGSLTTNSFAAPVTFATGTNPQCLVVGDLDGDGRPDIATANNNYASDNSVSILRNVSSPGAISFSPHVDLAGMPTSYCIAIGDLDGDGKLDLAVSSFINGQAVSVYRNTSTPGSLTTSSFAPHVDFALGGWGNSVAIGDLDGDGKPDLAVVTQLGDGLSIFKNNSTPGSFTTNSLAAPVNYPAGWNPNGVAIGDLDGDGRPEIAFAATYAATLSIYQNLTAPAVAAPSTNPPVITSINPHVGTVGTTVVISGTNFSPVAVNNIVYFGAVKANVFSASATSLTVTVPLGATYAPVTVTANGLIAFSSRPFEPTFVGSGSIDASSFASSFNLGAGNTPAGTAIGDLDGDGKPDLVLINAQDNSIWIYRNLSTNGALAAASFAPPVILSLAGNPIGLALADLDGDGRLDVLVTDNQNNHVSVFQNLCVPGSITTNSFATRVDFPVGQQPFTLAAMDLNGDGRADIVTVNLSDNTFSVLQNLGSPGGITTNSFAAHVDFATGLSPEGVAIGDLDGDGRPDIAVANIGGNSVSVFRNLNPGGNITTNSFAPRVDFTGAGGGEAVAIGDIDGDGKPDLLISGYVPQVLSVFQNLSVPGSLTTNSFGPRIDFPTGGRAHRIAVSDLDGDGKPDIAVTTELPSQLVIFKNISTPGILSSSSLAAPVAYPAGWNPNSVSIGDLDGDGRPDIFLANGYDGDITVYHNAVPSIAPSAAPVISSFTPAAGTNGTTVTISGNNFSAMVTADIVYFGAVRAAVFTASPTNLLVTVPAGATLAPVTVTVNGLTAYSSSLFLPTFSGAGPLTSSSLNGPLNLPAGNGPARVVVGDLDGDGKPDVVVANVYDGSVWIYRNISTNGPLAAASFAPPVIFTIGGGSDSLYGLALADLDGDGRLDIVTANRNLNIVSIFQNLSSPGNLNTNSFGARVDIAVAGSPSGVAVMDLDDDGRPEIVTANQASNSVSVLQNLCLPGIITTNSFAPAVSFAVGAGTFAVTIADIDGDGHPDIVTANSTSASTVSILRNTCSTGIISFASEVDFPGLGSGGSVAVADLDGDGKLDVVCGSQSTGQAVSVYRNTSTPGSITTSSLAPNVDFATGGWANTVAIGDLDGDGKPDLVVDVQLPSQLSIFKNISTPGSLTTSSFGARIDFPSGWNPNGIAIADLDGDGRPDITFGNDYDGTISIYQNQAPFGTAPIFIIQPTNQIVPVGGIATFAVMVQGAPPLYYQWAFNGTNISGATNSTLTLTNVQLSQAGNYVLQAVNNLGSVLSSNAVLSVFVPAIPPTILSQTPNQIVLLGNPATFSVAASGSNPLNYFWLRNGAPISGATNSSYTLYNAQLSDSGSKFGCLVTNAYGSASSTNVSLKVIDSTVANDLCSGAIAITNASYTNVQSTVTATSFGDPVPDCVDGFGHGVWYQFTSPVAGLLIVDTFGSDFDTGLALYTGSCDSLTEAACNDDTGGVTSQVILPTTPGTTYYILAGGYSSDAGNLMLHLNHLTPPAFVVQPTNQSVVVSSNASFTATLAGTVPMSFQWYFNNAPLVDDGRISGSTNSTLNIATILTNDAGSYQLVASNLIGVATSSVAILTPIILPPVITQQPANQSVLIGSNVTFTAGIVGTPPYSFQWSLNGSLLTDDGIHINGSATSTLVVSNLTVADAGSYSLLVTNVSGATNTMAAVLTVLVPPTITTQPVGRSVPVGLPTIFNAVAAGVPSPSYQWQFNGTNISDANSTTYTIGAGSTNTLGFYQVIAQNSVGSVTSVVAQLTFGPVAAWGRNLNNESLPPPGLSNVVAIAGTSGAGFAVRSDGSIVPWGSSGSPNVTNFPASATNVVAISSSSTGATAALRSDGVAVGWNGPALPQLSNIVSVAVGGNLFGLALRADGTVNGWGVIPYSTVPANLSSVTAIACGYSHSLALRNDGTVVAWGAGAATNVPAGLSGVTAIAAGSTHSLALKNNGTVVAWGSGLGTNVPTGLSNIVAISASSISTGQTLCLAVQSNGMVVAWGNNPDGETNPPAALTNLDSVAVAATTFHGLALVNDGSPQILQPPVGLTAYTGRNVTLQASAVGAAPMSYQWLLNGTNISGATNSSLSLPNIQLASAGNYQLLVSNAINTAVSLPAPVNVIVGPLTILTQITASQTNLYQGGKFTVGGLTVQGSGPVTYQWFFSPTNKNYMTIPNATNTTLTMDPAFAANSGNYYLAASNLVGGATFISGVTSAPVNIRVLFAKAWGFGAVSNPPVNVTNAIAIATGGAAGNSSGDYFALGSDGKLTAWASYQAIYGETNVSALTNSIVTAIAAGYEDSLALKSDGTVYAWGYGAYGETNVPSGLSGVTAIACGPYDDLALKSDGTVVGWGGASPYNYGQTTNNPAASNVVAIAAGTYHSLALRADGSVVSWGYTPDLTTIPAAATNVIAIAAGGNFNVALRANGTVVQWGNGILSYPTPVNLSNIVAVSASGTHATALKNDGTVLTWGNEYIGLASNNIPSDLTNVIAITSGGDHDMALFGTRAPAFTVQPWDRAVDLTARTNIIIAAKCAGVQPVSYQWQLNGTNVPGATNDTLLLTNNPSLQFGPIRAIPTGAYQLVASNAYGVVASQYAKVTSFYPLGTALNATNLVWTTSGNAQWFGETNVSHDGVSAAQSGGIGALQQTILQTTVGTNVPGSYTFWWKVSSEQDFDILEFRINGIVQASISGLLNWQQINIPVAAGTNVLMWRYYKDASIDVGQDAGWVDQFAFVPAPVILSQPQPASQTVNVGATVSYRVIATGATNLNYQWWQNGIMPVGGNNPALVLSNVGRAQNGTYSVIVTNAGGSVSSSVVSLSVLVPQLLGTPHLMPNGSFQLTSTDANGGLLSPADLANFQAQTSTNLVNWVTLPNALSLTNGMLLLLDPPQTNSPARYYRILEY